MEPLQPNDPKRQPGFWQRQRPVKNWTAALVILLLLGAGIAAVLLPGQLNYNISTPRTYVQHEGTALMDTASTVMRGMTGTANGQEQRIMYSAQMQLETSNVDTAEQLLQSSLADMGGYVIESRRWSSNEQPYLRLQVRVPVARFEEALTAFAALGEVKEQSVQGQDVTQEYMDVSARLRNKQQQEQRYLELLGEAQSVEDVLSVERELERIRVEIESMQGRIQFLESRTDYAAITVTVTEPVEVQWAGVSWDLLLQDMVQAMVNNLQNMLLFVSAVLPWAVLGVIVLWLILRRRH